MKLIFFVVVWHVMAGYLFAQVEYPPSEGIEDVIKSIQESGNESSENISFQDLKRLHVALAANRGNVWMLPEPILQNLRSKVEPIRDVVFELASSGDENRRFYASVFASYLEPTNDTKLLLESLAYDAHAPASGTAMDTLFGMGWESEKLQSDVVSSLGGAFDGEPSTMASVARNNAGRWGLVEAAPILMDILEKEYNEKGKITSIATQMKLLGETAQDQLPRLRELLLRVESDPKSHPREIEALNFAVGVISGEYKAPQEPSVQSPPASTPPSPKKPTDQKSVPSPLVEESPASTQWPLVAWSIILLLIVAAISLLWLLLKRRTK
jgi:hypothetical protein